MIQRQITVFVTKKIRVAFFVGVGMGHELKPESLLQQFFFLHFLHLLCAEYGFQDPAVSLQGIVDVANHRVGGRFQIVIIGIATVIIAEFFICTPLQGFAAGKAFAFGNRRFDHRFSKVLNSLSVYKRL